MPMTKKKTRFYNDTRMAWKNFISPWIFAPPAEEEVDEKKQKKMERKMRRLR
jgi:hypothetical protein